jgi:hypothetical protein
LPLFVRPFLYFGYRYFWKLGVLDGANGFLFHFLQAFWFRLLVDVKLSDLERGIASEELNIDELARSFSHSLARTLPQPRPTNESESRPV